MCIDQESWDAFVSESVALSSLADQVVRVSSEVTFETGPVPWEITGASLAEARNVIITFPCPIFTPEVLF